VSQKLTPSIVVLLGSANCVNLSHVLVVAERGEFAGRVAQGCAEMGQLVGYCTFGM
jgi:hypothetical protein